MVLRYGMSGMGWFPPSAPPDAEGAGESDCEVVEMPDSEEELAVEPEAELDAAEEADTETDDWEDEIVVGDALRMGGPLDEREQTPPCRLRTTPEPTTNEGQWRTRRASSLTLDGMSIVRPESSALWWRKPDGRSTR
jgi:hypothetical protein